MFDIFYLGNRAPEGVHAVGARDIDHACEMSRTRYCWIVNYLSDYSNWDFLWEPAPWQSYQRHAWPNQHQLDGGTYLVPKAGYSETTWHESPVLHRYSDPDFWYIPDYIDPASIDSQWSPDPMDPPYIYEFPVEWGWDRIGGAEYRMPDAVGRKFVSDFTVTTKHDSSLFEIQDNLLLEDSLFRWRPNPTDPPYIYVFGNQWWPAEKRTSATYTVPGAVERKYINEVKATRCASNGELWQWLYSPCRFDLSWEPDPDDPPYIYVFGNQWHDAEIMPTMEYHMPGASERKFVDYPRATLLETNTNWHVPEHGFAFEFDRSWCPDPGDPPYIYVFGNQWHGAEIMSTIEYHMPGATERKFIMEPVATLQPDQRRWTVPEEVDGDAVDFSWIPDPGDPPYIYHFGTDYQSSVNLTYTVPGASEIKFAGDIPQRTPESKTIKTLDIFYMDRSNASAGARFDALAERYPGIQRVRYFNSVLDTVKRCAKKSTTQRFWVIGSENDYSEFDFDWHPEPWQRSMTHVFGSQWNKWSDTFLINRWEFDRHCRWADSIEQFPNLNFVENQTVHAPADAYSIFVIDHGNPERDQVFDHLETNYRVVKQARYFDNYLDTLKRLVDSVEDEYIWVTSTVCDYQSFDFSWQPEAWQKHMLHVFPSNEQKFGDTFFLHVPSFKHGIENIELLDWFETVNYATDQTVPRWPMPVVEHSDNSHVDLVKTHTAAAPLTVFTVGTVPTKIPTVSLWRDKTKTVMPLDSGATTVIVPKEAHGVVKTQLYDYAYIDKTQANNQVPALDVVFVSNGETVSQTHLQRLRAVLPNNQQLHVVEGINGRLEAFKKAAELASTDWFILVPAKLNVAEDFDWNWQSDRMQQPKHYIFHAHNPTTGLTYGHMAAVAYNKDLLLSSTGTELDLTMEKAHEVVPVISGTAVYGDEITEWRTAFREAIKLQASLPNIENEYRLSQWKACESKVTRHAVESALDYFASVNGDSNKLQNSFSWEWVTRRYESYAN